MAIHEDLNHDNLEKGTHDKSSVREKPDDSNESRPVLKPSRGSDFLA